MTTSHLARRAPATIVLLVALTTACGLLDTNQPDIINPGSLDSPEGAKAKRNGAIANFTFGKDGDGDFNTNLTDGAVLLSGILADEFTYAGPNPTEQEVDQRNAATNNPQLDAVFFYLQKARVSAEDAASALQKFSPDPTQEPGIPEMLALAGYTYLYFGEDFCSSVPYSTILGDTLAPGPSDSTTGSLLRAIERFDSALAQPAAVLDTGIINLALVGKARALLDLNQTAAAAAEVASVPTTFQYVTEHDQSPLRLNNPVWSLVTDGVFSMSDLKGGVGFPYRSVGDPRTPFTDAGGPGLDLVTPLFLENKYPDAGSPVPVADGVEARLIEAEALLQAHDSLGMKVILDALRQGFVPVIDTLPVPQSRREAEDQLFGERALWLYATGHRLGDMRRLIRQYGRQADSVFASGPYLKGGVYGTDVNLQVPITEENNPQFVRAQCDPTVP